MDHEDTEKPSPRKCTKIRNNRDAIFTSAVTNARADDTQLRSFRSPGDMETTQADLRIGDYEPESIRDSFRHEDYQIQASTDDSNISHDLDTKRRLTEEPRRVTKNSISAAAASRLEPNLNSIQHLAADVVSTTRPSSYPDSLDSETSVEEIASGASEADEIFPTSNDHSETYDISSVVIPNVILEELSCSINEKSSFASKWLNRDSKNSEKSAKLRKITSSGRDEISSKTKNLNSFDNEIKIRKTKRRRRVASFPDNPEESWNKTECTREKRKMLYESESEERRLDRLAKEAAKRREMRMYYEMPEERRKRLDAEAARKREYRMYNEAPDERRKRLDREAERRRIKRLTTYANETPEERRERLNKESAKRREARVNQYAKETDEQRQERLRKDAVRAREMRFTRSAIETDDERKERLIKDALRKRELRMNGGTTVSHLTELQTVRNFEELNDSTTKDDDDNQFGGHYLSNWMMWFQNTLTQPVNSSEKNDG